MPVSAMCAFIVWPCTSARGREEEGNIIFTWLLKQSLELALRCYSSLLLLFMIMLELYQKFEVLALISLPRAMRLKNAFFPSLEIAFSRAGETARDLISLNELVQRSGKCIFKHILRENQRLADSLVCTTCLCYHNFMTRCLLRWSSRKKNI